MAIFVNFPILRVFVYFGYSEDLLSYYHVNQKEKGFHLIQLEVWLLLNLIFSSLHIIDSPSPIVSIPNQSSESQLPTPVAFGKSKSISDMEKPEDASVTCRKPNGKNGIETKPTPKVINEWSDDIDALLPKLVRHSCYYTIPTMEELAAKEQAEPGYLGHVNNFVVGLHGVGSIKFVGEIDLRGVELDSNFEIVPERIGYTVIKSMQPLQGFNGTAEITMLVPEKLTLEEMRRSDIKAWIHSYAARVEKQVEDSGGQCVLYNPIVGEFKWKVKYFSGLGLIGFKGKKETSKPESISDMEKPEDASLTCPKPNGENNIETKTGPNESSDNIKALMPKLRHSYYYTKPTIEELEARERAEPGYIGRVKDFVMGRHGVGSIRFLGEIDLRGVDLETFIQMVPGKITYGGLKPLPPQEFNDTAELTLVTTKDKFTKKEMGRWDIRSRICSLTRSYKKRVENDGEQFISYDPSKGEYKWRTKYFSGLGLIGFKEKEKKKMTMKNNIFINCFICSNHQVASTWNTFSGPWLVAYLF